MSCLSFALVVLCAFVPPFQLAARAHQGEIVLPTILGVRLSVPIVLILAWLLLWALGWLVAKILKWHSADEWIGQLVESAYPQSVFLFFPSMCFITILLALGVTAVINLLFDSNFKLEPEAVTLGLFGLVAELGRAIEAAARDERLWIENNIQRMPD